MCHFATPGGVEIRACALKLLWCFALKISVIYFRVEDSLIFMCEHMAKVWYTVGGGTVLRFFIGKMDQEMTVFWSKTEVLGQFCVFFLNDN